MSDRKTHRPAKRSVFNWKQWDRESGKETERIRFKREAPPEFSPIEEEDDKK